MKVLHLSTYDKNGGAGIAAYRLNRVMNKNGIDSKILLLHNKLQCERSYALHGALKKIKDAVVSYASFTLKDKILRVIFYYSLGMAGFDVSKMELVRNADIIYIHWINDNFLGIKDLNRIISLNKPVVFFMHDMWLLTGGCHHSFECKKYQTYCKKCPNIPNRFFSNLSSYVFSRKRKMLLADNVFVQAPSRWLVECVRKSALFGDVVVDTVPNTFDDNIFKPVDKSLARTVLNLPLHKKLLLFGANGGHKNPYKGWEYLVEALRKSNLQDVEVVVLGSKLDNHSRTEISCRIHSVGTLYDEYSLALLYSAVDVFVTPSLADNFPNTILESLACATPVVAFNVGGIPDLVRHTKTGYLAKYKDATDLAVGIDWCLGRSQDSLWHLEIRDFVMENFSAKTVVNKHFDFWEKNNFNEQ